MSSIDPSRPREEEAARSLEPSTLFAFWPEAEPPLDEEVRLALQREFPGCEWKEELDAAGGVVWGGVYRIPGHQADVLVWAEERAELSDTMLEEVPLDALAREQARSSRWLLGVETYLDPQQAQSSFHFQLRVMVAACVPGLPAIYDDNAVVVRPGSHVADLCSTAVPPRASTLYAIHAVAGYGGTWLHTHGLNRTGVPELDMVALPADNLHEGYELMDAVVDSLFSGCLPDARGRLTLGEDLVLRALPLDDAMRRVPERFAGGSGDRMGELSDHGGERLVLFDLAEDEPPYGVLSRLNEDGVVYKSQSETRRLSLLSRERWGTFGQLFVMHREDAWRFHVKMACPRKGVEGLEEHLWFEVLDLEPDRVKGRLISDPVDVPALMSGDEVWHPLAHLTDWIIITPEGPFDPEGAPSLLSPS